MIWNKDLISKKGTSPVCSQLGFYSSTQCASPAFQKGLWVPECRVRCSLWVILGVIQKILKGREGDLWGGEGEGRERKEREGKGREIFCTHKYNELLQGLVKLYNREGHRVLTLQRADLASLLKAPYCSLTTTRCDLWVQIRNRS